MDTIIWMCGTNGAQNPQADLERSSELAQKALALDDSNSDALALLSDIDWMQMRFDQAVIDGERAVAINPNYAGGYQALSDALELLESPKKHFAPRRRRCASIHGDQTSTQTSLEMPTFKWGATRRRFPLQALPRGAPKQSSSLTLGWFCVTSSLVATRTPELRLPRSCGSARNFALPPPEKGWHKDLAWNERWDRDFRKAGLEVMAGRQCMIPITDPRTGERLLECLG